MTTITLEVPDSLASQLDSLRHRLPDILLQTIDAWSQNTPSFQLAKSYPVYEEMMDFLASGPTPQQIIEHRMPISLQERLEELLEKNREENLSEEEFAELNAFEQVNDVMSSLKLRARRTN